MARKLKPHVIENLSDRHTHEKTTIFFDRDEKDFFAKVGDQTYRKSSVSELRQVVRQALAEYRPYVWNQYIFVEGGFERGHRWGGGYLEQYRSRIDFCFYRKEVAKKDNGDHLLRRILDEKNLCDEDFITLAENRRHNEGPKDEQAWFENAARRNLESRAEQSDIESYGPRLEDYANIVMPFSEEAWVTLHAIRERIRLAECQLDELVNGGNFQKKLLEVSKNLKLLGPKK